MQLGDIVRRQGWFDVLPGGFVALRHRGLATGLLRLARMALRGSGVKLTVSEILRQRPELEEFRPCIAELLDADPLVQTQDGNRYCLV